MHISVSHNHRCYKFVKHHLNCDRQLDHQTQSPVNAYQCQSQSQPDINICHIRFCDCYSEVSQIWVTAQMSIASVTKQYNLVMVKAVGKHADWACVQDETQAEPLHVALQIDRRIDRHSS